MQFVINSYDKNYNLLYFLKLSLGVLLFRLSLDFVYINHISTIFNYTGFINDFQLEKYVYSWIILLIFIPIIFTLHSKITFSSMILILLGYLSIVPFTTMVAYYPFNTAYIGVNVLYWIMVYFFYKVIPAIRLNHIKKDKYVELILYIIISIFLINIIYISWRYTGFRFTLDIYNVYDLRSESSSFTLPIIVSYLYSAAKAVNPILLIYFLSRKKYRITFVIFIIQLLSFSINGSKTVLFSTIIAVIIYWIYNVKYIRSIPWLLFILVIISSLEIFILNTMLLLAFIIRRLLFVPNLLNYNYYDFFSVNSPDYLSQSFLRYLGIESDYPPIDNMIGAIYYNEPEMGANNGLLSDALANLGWIGLIVYPLLLVVILKILDACAEGLDKRIYIISAITVTFILISSFLSTALLTHGIVAICIIMYLLPRTTVHKRNEGV